MGEQIQMKNAMMEMIRMLMVVLQSALQKNVEIIELMLGNNAMTAMMTMRMTAPMLA